MFLRDEGGLEGGETWFPGLEVGVGVGGEHGEGGDGAGAGDGVGDGDRDRVDVGKERDWIGDRNVEGYERKVNREGRKWRHHPEGGTAFKPLPCNALFWANLDSEGRGDERVTHAGLAVERGEKWGMNIWVRRFY